MRRAVCRIIFCFIAAALIASNPVSAQQTSGTFRWIDFHSQKDQNIVTWVTRSLVVENWTAIREIGVEYDAALVVTSDRANPQAAPGAGTFSIWSVSLTSHLVVPLVTGVNLRWFDQVRFSDTTPQEWPVLYDNCRNCAPNTYFTAFYYDLRTHAWTARWMTGGHGVPVWNADHPDGVNWTQVYAVMSNGEGHVALYTWNHFDYGKGRKPEDFIYRFDLDPFSDLARTEMLNDKQDEAIKLEMCRGGDSVEGLQRGQNSELCQQLLRQRGTRIPVTTPPANNQGRSLPPGARR